MRLPLVVGLLGLVVGCGGVVANGGDGGTENAAANGDAATRGDAGTNGDEDAGGEAAAPPAEIGSRQTVTLRVTNATGADRWWVEDGRFCTPFAVDGLSLQLGFSCTCECAAPGSAKATTYRRLRAGETVSVTWDARALALFTTPVDCAARGWSGAGLQQEQHGVLQPVAAGRYTLRMAYEDAPPTDCTIEGDQARCPWGYDRFPSGPLPGRIAGLCTSSKVATVDVSLPPSGDVAVDVPLR